MIMIDFYWYEFSKIYARLMRLEIQIKRNIIYAVEKNYTDHSYSRFIWFFKDNNKRRNRYTYDNKCKFDKIINNKKLSDNEKFRELVNILYLSDLLNMVLKTTQFKTIAMANDFYYKTPDDITILLNSMKNLIDLRNCIAHYKFEEYENNKKRFLDSLFLFEIHLGHNIGGILELPKINKPSTKSILNAISIIKPELIITLNKNKNPKDPLYFNQHRMLLTLFDDIAIYNGMKSSNLPSPWSILREMFRLKAQLNPKEEVNIEDLPLLKALKELE